MGCSGRDESCEKWRDETSAFHPLLRITPPLAALVSPIPLSFTISISLCLSQATSTRVAFEGIIGSPKPARSQSFRTRILATVVRKSSVIMLGSDILRLLSLSSGLLLSLEANAAWLNPRDLQDAHYLAKQRRTVAALGPRSSPTPIKSQISLDPSATFTICPRRGSSLTGALVYYRGSDGDLLICQYEDGQSCGYNTRDGTPDVSTDRCAPSSL